MHFTLTVNMDNAAFEDQGELPRILQDLAVRLRYQMRDFRVLDVNGNHVGDAVFERDVADDPEKERKFFKCGICKAYHRIDYAGDCRDANWRFSPGDLDEKFGAGKWIEVLPPE